MEISLLTDIGQKRSNNQDYVNKYDNKSGITLILLADGMGGHKAGHIASEMTVTDLGREWIATDFTDMESMKVWLLEKIEEENQKIHELGQTEEYKGMGTTIEALILVGDYLLYAHLGDSRIHLMRNGVLVQLTEDHSLVNELLKAGQITEEEAAIHPQRNIITQSVGQSSPLQLDIGTQHLQAGDIILANSDGLSNMITKDSILSILIDEDDLSLKAQKLVESANLAGGSDNITVALVSIESEETK